MRKKGNVIDTTLIVLIVLVIFCIIGVLIFYFVNGVENIENKPENKTSKDFDYYLPADFAVLKVYRGVLKARLSGVRIVFNDGSNEYNFESENYPLIKEEREYIILKDDLNPAPSEEWKFSDVKYISLYYIMEEGGFSRRIQEIEVGKSESKSNYDSSCSIVEGSGEKKVVCG